VRARANNAFCNDGLFCNGVETCSAAGAAPLGASQACRWSVRGDGIPCTDDICNEATKVCVHVANNNNCGAGQFLRPQNGCGIKPCVNSAQCQDNDLCNGVEACVGGFLPARGGGQLRRRHWLHRR